MKKSTLTVLFTLAILAGLAAAPGAQTFRWEPNHGPDVGERVSRAIERAHAAADRRWELIERQWDRRVASSNRAAQAAERTAARRAAAIERQVEARVTAQVRRQIHDEVRMNHAIAMQLDRGTRTGRYAEMQVGGDADPCRTENWNDESEQHCEVREFTMPAGPLNVDAGQNGGIVVEGWDSNQIRVRAIVRGQAREAARAREIAGQVQVEAASGRVYATGPEGSARNSRERWQVSYRISVPHKNDLDLRAANGGITIVAVTGNMRFDTVNGGVKLQDIGGRVNGETRNGGLNVMLSGNKWDGEGLDVETSNGGVTLSLPDGYNAELETRTVNGGLRIDFPMTVQGDLTGRRGLQTTLGSGGPLVRVRTTNGGVRINRR